MNIELTEKDRRVLIELWHSMILVSQTIPDKSQQTLPVEPFIRRCATLIGAMAAALEVLGIDAGGLQLEAERARDEIKAEIAKPVV